MQFLSITHTYVDDTRVSTASTAWSPGSNLGDMSFHCMQVDGRDLGRFRSALPQPRPRHGSRAGVLRAFTPVSCNGGLPHVDVQLLTWLCGVALSVSTAYRIHTSVERGSQPIHTQSGKQAWTKPMPEEDPCKACFGHGRVPCGTCYGDGIFNVTNKGMLPKGEKLHICWDCRGSTMLPCLFCGGTGIRPPRIGFRT